MGDIEDSVRLRWEGDAVRRLLDLQLVEWGPGTCTVSMTVGPAMTDRWELCHGGLLAAFADSVFALTCNTTETVNVGAGFDISLLESAWLGDDLVATAVLRAVRGRSGIYDVTIHRPADDTVIAEFRGRSRTVMDRSMPA